MAAGWCWGFVGKALDTTTFEWSNLIIKISIVRNLFMLNLYATMGIDKWNWKCHFNLGMSQITRIHVMITWSSNNQNQMHKIPWSFALN